MLQIRASVRRMIGVDCRCDDFGQKASSLFSVFLFHTLMVWFHVAPQLIEVVWGEPKPLVCSCVRKLIEFKCYSTAGFLQCACVKPVIYFFFNPTLISHTAFSSFVSLELHRGLSASVSAEYSASWSPGLCSSFSSMCERHHDAICQCFVCLCVCVGGCIVVVG